MTPGKKTRRRQPDPANRRHYTAEFIACAVIACRANGLDTARTAAELGMPEPTLRGWIRGRRRAGLLALCDATKGDMTAAFRDVIWASLTAALGKLDEATFAQLMTGAGIAFDKMRVLQGQSTIVTEQRTVSVDVAKLAERMTDEQLTQLVGILEAAMPPAAPDEPGGG